MEGISIILALFAVGLVGGLVGGTIGIGGGIIFVLVLPEALAHQGVLPQEIAQYTVANSLFAILCSSLASNWALYKAKNIYPKEVIIIGGVSVITATLVLKGFVNTAYYDKFTFDVIVLSLISFMLVRTLISARKAEGSPYQPLTNQQRVGIGLISGSVAPLSGLGGGIVIIPIINGILKYEVRIANSISLGVIGITSLWTTLLNLAESPVSPVRGWTMGYLSLEVAGPLALGVIIASPYGVRYSRKMKAAHINYLFASFMILSIVKKIIELFFTSSSH